MWIILLDHSGSMGESFTGKKGSEFVGLSRVSEEKIKLDAAKHALLQHLQTLPPGDVALIEFTLTASVVFEGASDDLKGIQQVLDSLDAEDGTDISVALDEITRYVLKKKPGEGQRNHQVLVISDGLSDRDKAETSANRLAEIGVISALTLILIDPTDRGEAVAQVIRKPFNGFYWAVTTPQELSSRIADAAPSNAISLPLTPSNQSRRMMATTIVGLMLVVVGITIYYIFRYFSVAPSLPKDLSSPDLHLVPKYVGQMQVNHAYIVSVVLSSPKGNVPLSSVSASVVNGQSMPLHILLGQQNTPCAVASLIVDQTAFSVQPPQPQEYSLEQSQITWIWSVTPLRGDLQMPQEIPVRILFSGKFHCGMSDVLAGPYPFAGNFSLRIMVQDPTSSPSQGAPFSLFILLSGLSLLLSAFLTWLSIFLWRRKRRRERHPVKTLETQQTTANTSISFFYCYAREDKVLRDQLGKHLSPLERLGQIITWHDGEIVPGTLWNEEITTRLNAAHIILLLISPDFVASDYCYSKEMAQAISRHQAGEAAVIPIILRPVRWQETPIGKLQALPANGKPVSSWSNIDDAFYDVVQGIRLLLTKLPTRS